MDLKPNRKSLVLADTVVPSLPPYSSSSAAAAFSSGLISTNDWIDAMKNHSNDPASEESTTSEFKLWTLKYPSALTSFGQIANCAQGKKIALFLDYDGTLSPIVNDPDSAFMSKKMRRAVKSAAECFPIAIISGRSRDKVFEFVGLSEVYYAGSHGMDIMGPVRNSESVNHHPNCIRTTDMQGKESHLFQPAGKFIPTIDKICSSLVETTKSIEGSKVENNKFCVSVHYRLVEQKNWPVVLQTVQDILKDYPNLQLKRGRKVLEIRPDIDWNKGKAVEFLLESLRLTDSEDVLPIYIGDDRTDEDAFKVLRERSHGYGILVSSIPKESNAFYSLKDPTEVLVFLKSLVRWKASAHLRSMNK